MALIRPIPNISSGKLDGKAIFLSNTTPTIENVSASMSATFNKVNGAFMIDVRNYTSLTITASAALINNGLFCTYSGDTLSSYEAMVGNNNTKTFDITNVNYVFGALSSASDRPALTFTLS